MNILTYLVDTFNCYIGGSYLLYLEKYLELEDITDIDIFCHDYKEMQKIANTLEYLGYKSSYKAITVDRYGNDYYNGDNLYIKNNELKPIHLILKNGEKQSTQVILTEKIKRVMTKKDGWEKDLNHLNIVLQKLKEKNG